MKKIAVLLMSFVMAAGLAACSSGGSTDTSAASGQDTQEASIVAQLSRQKSKIFIMN